MVFGLRPLPPQVALARTGSGETSQLPSRLPEDAESISLVVWSAMNAVRKALVVVSVLGAGAGVGSTLFALVTPGELQKQAMLQVETPGLPKVGVCGERPCLRARAANILLARRSFRNGTRGAGRKLPGPRN